MSGYPSMSALEITNSINPIILYLQECSANRTLHTILLVIPHETDAYIQRMESVHNNLQAVIANSTSMIIPEINYVNVLFHQLLPLLQF